MSARHLNMRNHQSGIVLICSLLLLLVVTIIALAMFRSMGLGEKISGNERETQRALHAAVLAEQYAEWWLSSAANSAQAPVVCSAPASANASASNVLICINALSSSTTLPWTNVGGNPVGFSYYPNATGATATNMSFAPDGSGSFSNTYYTPPVFYIQYLGNAADNEGSVFKVDAVGYGGSLLSVAVVESTYEIGSGVRDLTRL
jgi:type IV pilus assembly protein PilX